MKLHRIKSVGSIADGATRSSELKTPQPDNRTMSRPFKLEIIESEAELRQRLHLETDARIKEKLMMLWWLKTGQVKQQELGQKLARDTSTISRWLQKYRSQGLVGLLKRSKAPGAARKMSQSAIAALQQKLVVGWALPQSL